MKVRAPAKSQRGGPRKSPARGVKRLQIGPIISADMKRRLDQEAERSGRTISQVVEWLLEYALAYNEIQREVGEPLAQIAAKNFRAEMRRRGWVPFRDPKRPGLWLEPKYVAERSGFIAWTDEEKADLDLRKEKVVRPDDMTDEEWAQFNEDRKAGRIKDEEK
jgi:hypothetical protein